MSDKSTNTSTNTSTNKSTVQLLPCPFCGGEVTMVKDVVDARRYSYTFQCDNCMMYSVYQYCNDEDGAITAWNTRKPMERIVERLEEQEKQYKRREKEHEGKNITVKLSEKYYGKACSYGHAIEIVKEEM